MKNRHTRDNGHTTRYHYTVGTGIPEHHMKEIADRLSESPDVLRFEHTHDSTRNRKIPQNIQTRKLRRGVVVEVTLSYGRLWRCVVRCPAYHHEPAQDLSLVLQWHINDVVSTPTIVTAWWNEPTDWHRLTNEDSQQYKR